MIGLYCSIYSQPSNDDCNNAEIVNLGTGNFGIGTFISNQHDLTNATIQSGESFHSTLITAGNDKKSIWFQFTLPTTRGVKVELKQPGNAIPTADAGFTVYLSNSCLPPLSAIEPAKLTPVNKFGSTFNPCLVPGTYLVQVSSKLNANGPVFIEITTSYPGVLNDYDFPTMVSAHNIGTVTTAGTGWLSFDVGCQTIENASETCPALTNSSHYTQSTWHVFRTPSFIDFLRIQFRRATPGVNFTIGYQLYLGDIRTISGSNPWTSLTTVDGCAEITGSGIVNRDYFCQLVADTFYTIQIFHHKDSVYTFELNLDVVGAGITKAPIDDAPPYIPASMQLGTLSTGTYLVSDIWSCAARMSVNPCGTVKPSGGVILGGNLYDLNDWITFTLSSYANVSFNLSGQCGTHYYYGRLFSGDVNNHCSLTLINSFSPNTNISCLAPGTYSLQILGRSSTSNPFNCNYSDWGQPINVAINVATALGINAFSYSTITHLDSINSLNPLPHNISINSANDVFGCANTLLPTDKCGGASTVKAIYRILKIGDSDGDGIDDSGFLTVGGLSGNFWYKLYQGDIRTISPGNYPTTFNPAPVLTDISGCFNYYTYSSHTFTTCVYPGIYTIVTFGDASDINYSDQIWVRFYKLQSKFNLGAAGRVDKINAVGGVLQDLVSGNTYNTVRDTFDCHPTVRPSGTLCSVTIDRCIYRSFKIGTNGYVVITGTGSNQYMLYQGDATVYGGPYNYPNTISGWTPVTNCFSGSTTVCLTPGIYTLVTQGANNPGAWDQPTIYFNAPVTQFHLSAPGKVDKINSNNPLVPGTLYTSTLDVFDCNKTVLPAGTLCGSADRAIYRTFQVNTSGVITITGTCNRTYKLYAGDADALATSYTWPNTIPGLVEISNCFNGDCGSGTQLRTCITPGFYTLVSFGNFSNLGQSDQPTFHFTTYTTLFYDPLTGHVNSMGNMNNGGTGTIDYFSCLNNPQTLDGQAPCSGATKLIYREFELTQPTHLSISLVPGTYGTLTLFTGWASDPGGFSNLALYNPSGSSDPAYGVSNWLCFTSQSTKPCNKLPPGKYTVVSYGTNAHVGLPNNIVITKLADPTPPSFQNPGQAYNAGNVNWNVAGDGVAYPNTKQSYTFATEHFDCSRQLPNGLIIGCDPLAPGPANSLPPHQGNAYNRTAYYVFHLQSEAYLRIRNIPSDMRVQLYPLDVRTNDSTLLNTTPPVQDCITKRDIPNIIRSWCTDYPWIGEIEICKLQPGPWTLVIYANDNHVGSTVTPILIFEKVETSRFDHASTAYDFGNVPGDNVMRFGKVGDTNPLHSGRAPSHDFFTCTTGARSHDPQNTGHLSGGYPLTPPVSADTSSVPYPMPNNYAIYGDPFALDTTLPPIRRNLWYTFTVKGGGTVTVRVENKSSGYFGLPIDQVPFAIYKSDVNGTIPFSAIAGGTENDSTYAMGLTFVANNRYENWASGCFIRYNLTEISFNRSNYCDTTTERYYIIVDHNVLNEVNFQVEVGIKFNSVLPPSQPYYDFYSWANHIIDNVGQPAMGPLGTIPLDYGQYKGYKSNFLCRTHSPASDQAACAPRSIWYVFDCNVYGRGRINYSYPSGRTYNANEMVVYREIIAGDSTPVGLLKLSPYVVTAAGYTWGEFCVTPGRYYIMMTGCSFNTDTIQPYL